MSTEPLTKDLRSSRLFRKAVDSLFDSPESREAFAEAVCSGQCQSPALIWTSPRPDELPFPVLPVAEWQPGFVDAVPYSAGAGRHPLHEAGAYYCLDRSSVFEASSLMDLAPRGNILDVCSSPGGKGIFAARALSPKLLICNEVIGKRSAALISNLSRCRIPAYVTNADVSVLGNAWPAGFQLLIIDAPCSGQSLIARGKKNPGCFHPSNIQLNSNRQKRILATASAMTAGEGHIAYMTCTYSREENEGVVEWFLKRFPDYETVEIPRLKSGRSQLSEQFCYRLFPQNRFGAGGFTTLLRNRAPVEFQSPQLSAIRTRQIV